MVVRCLLGSCVCVCVRARCGGRDAVLCQVLWLPATLQLLLEACIKALGCPADRLFNAAGGIIDDIDMIMQVRRMCARATYFPL